MYKLVFSDEFDYEGLPKENFWNIATGGDGFGNRELQHYTNRLDNLYVKDSVLHIVARKENYKQNQYTSGKITSFNKVHAKYGKIQVRAKLPVGGGTWPAIWTLGANIGDGVNWPACGEIDIMEFVGNKPNQVLFSIHSEGYNHKIGNNPAVIKEFVNIQNDFHVFELIWEPDKLIYKIDDVVHNVFEKGDKSVPKDWPFQAPHFLILNLAIGGTLGGEVDDSIFPAEFLIDYVRIYERVDED